MRSNDTRANENTPHTDAQEPVIDQPLRVAAQLRRPADELERLQRQASTDEIQADILNGTLVVTASYELPATITGESQPDAQNYAEELFLDLNKEVRR